jgi:hypothetical protein
MRFSYGLLYAALLLVVSAIVGACMQQGEGDVCSPFAGNNGNADCQDGYVCTPPGLLASGTMGYRCCPGDLALGTGVCALGQSMIPENPANPANDAGADASDAAQAEGGDANVATVEGGDANVTTVDAADAKPNDGSSSDAASADGSETIEAGDSAPGE